MSAMARSSSPPAVIQVEIFVNPIGIRRARDGYPPKSLPGSVVGGHAPTKDWVRQFRLAAHGDLGRGTGVTRCRCEGSMAACSTVSTSRKIFRRPCGALTGIASTRWSVTG